MFLRVLIAAPAPDLRRRLGALFELKDVLVSQLARGEKLFDRLGKEPYDLVVLGPGSTRGRAREVTAEIRALPDAPEVVALREGEQAEERAALLAAGALAVLPVHLPDDALQGTLEALLARRRADAMRRMEGGGDLENCRLSDFASDSPAMRRFLGIVQRVVASESSLLILGETGAGKEWLARAIHAESPRARGPFLAVNCAALPESLLESELFGHERGAFTGAVRAHRGAFELAHRGTLFLDEVGEIPAHLQAKLLRALQDRRITRVGGEEPLKVDVRIMAATNRDLAAEIRARRFRPDLYYRLGVVTLEVPPLRERPEDIPALLRSAIRTSALRSGRHLPALTDEALAALVAYPWPGNVRELFNVMERAVLLAGGDRLTPADLPEAIAALAPGAREAGPAGAPAPGGAAEPAGGSADAPDLERPWREARRAALDAAERAYLTAVLGRHQGRVGLAARAAGLSERALYAKMRRHGLRKEDFRAGRGQIAGR